MIRKVAPIPLNRRLLALLSLGHLAVDTTGGALPAILPFLQREFHLSYLLLGLVVMTSSVTSSIVQPAFGIASDLAAARYLLPLGVLLAVSGFAAVGVAPNYPLLLLAVAVSGMGNAIYHPEASKSAHFVVGERRATGMSVFSVGGNIGFAIGPLVLTAIVAWRGLHGTLLLVIPGALIATVLAAIMPAITRAQQVHEERQALNPGMQRPGAVALLVAVVALRSLVVGGLYTFVPLYAVNVLHRSLEGNGLLLFLFLGAGACGTLVAAPLADRFGKKNTMTLSLACAPPLLVTYLLVPGPLGVAALMLSGACLVGTFTITLVMGQEFLPHRLALASALMIGLPFGLGGLGVAALGHLADVAGLPTTLWALVGVAAAALALTLLLPVSEQRAAAHVAEAKVPAG